MWFQLQELVVCNMSIKSGHKFFERSQENMQKDDRNFKKGLKNVRVLKNIYKIKLKMSLAGLIRETTSSIK